ncbi:MAG: hypothetical protein ABF491_11915, partial [Acetobacter sp.]|uniref:hypothetical protein n=1 Tax=Acetobacter sp. TaxID=440 RepID=UPI0039E72C3A
MTNGPGTKNTLLAHALANHAHDLKADTGWRHPRRVMRGGCAGRGLREQPARYLGLQNTVHANGER